MNSSNKKIVFIRGDLNALQEGVIPLRNKVWIGLINEHYAPIHDGLKIWLYDRTQRNEKEDPTIFQGVIKETKFEDEYDIIVDEKDMKYLSQSDEFKDYSVNDVFVGEKYF